MQTDMTHDEALDLLSKWLTERPLLEVIVDAGPLGCCHLGQVEELDGKNVVLAVPPRELIASGEPGFVHVHLCRARFRYEQRAEIGEVKYPTPRDVLAIEVTPGMVVELSAVTDEELPGWRATALEQGDHS